MPISPEPEVIGFDAEVPVCIALDALLVLGNLLPIVVVLRIKKKLVSTDVIIVALSIVDVLSVLVPTPIGYVAYFTHSWFGGRHSCNFYQLSTNFFQLLSICFVTVLCGDRCLALRPSLGYTPLHTAPSRVGVLLTTIAVTALGFVCLPLLGLAPIALEDSGGCHSWLVTPARRPVELVFSCCFLAIGLANLLTTVVCSLRLFRGALQLRHSLNRPNLAQPLQLDNSSLLDLSVMTATLTGVFYLAWLPALVVISMLKLGWNPSQSLVFYSLLATTLTGLFNPLIYALFSRSYRRGYVRVLQSLLRVLCCCPPAHPSAIDDVATQAKRIRNASTETSMSTLVSPESDFSATTVQSVLLGDVASEHLCCAEPSSGLFVAAAICNTISGGSEKSSESSESASDEDYDSSDSCMLAENRAPVREQQESRI